MILTNLKLLNFRNYDNIDLVFSDNFNIFYGNNGEGKTNIVESIYVLAITKSFKVNHDELLVKKNCDSYLIEGKISTKVKTKYKINYLENNKNVYIDGSKCSSIHDYISRINVILFNPEDVFLIKDSPSDRRNLLNIEISKIYNDYLLILTKYNKILKMRNAFLRSNKKNLNTDYTYLDILTKNLINFGISICKYRDNFINDINKFMPECYLKIFSYGDLSIKYVSSFLDKSEDILYDNYKQNYQKEILLGKTLLGIHHDDLLFYLDGNLLRDWGSIGQHKNSILSFKIAEIKLLKEKGFENPILILDDLFSELDNDKISNILNFIDNDIQVFITTTDKYKFDFTLFNKYKIFKVENNIVLEEKNG